MSKRRPAAVHTMTLLALPALLLLVGLVAYVGLLRDVRTEVQNGADAIQQQLGKRRAGAEENRSGQGVKDTR